jgi:23S rRNA pseudouridine2605 synthase
VSGRKKRRNAFLFGRGCKLDPGTITAQTNVAEDEVHDLALEHSKRLIEIVDGRDDFITGVTEQILIIKGGQWFVLDDKDPLDDLLALTEQHGEPRLMTPVSERTNRPPVPRKGNRNRSRPESARADDAPQRIAKLLARAGIASRREVERMIGEGRIAVDGQILETPATLLRDLSGVTVDGKPVRSAAATRLFRFYKPQGSITASRDPGGRPTIYDRLPPGLPRLMPVGRLDFMTEGLLLLTNDGELKRQLELPRNGVVRTYRARAFGRISQSELEALSEGITIDGIRYGSINANLERRTGSNCWIEMSLTEGKNREVRRVLAHLGLKVSRLIRTSYGPFVLEPLEPGEVEEAASADVQQFRSSLG